MQAELACEQCPVAFQGNYPDRWALQSIWCVSAGWKGHALLHLIRVLQGVTCFKIGAAAEALGV